MQITGVKITTQKKGKEIVVPLSQKEMKKRAETRAPLGFRGVGGRWDEVGTKSAKSLKTLKTAVFHFSFFDYISAKDATPVKAVLDALNGSVFTDDSQVVSLVAGKDWQNAEEGYGPGVDVAVWWYADATCKN